MPITNKQRLNTIKYTIDKQAPLSSSETTNKRPSNYRVLHLNAQQEFERKVIICMDHLPTDRLEKTDSMTNLLPKGQEWEKARNEAFNRLSKRNQDT